MPGIDIPLNDLLAIAKKGNLDARGLPPAVAAEMTKTEALARKAAASEMIGILPKEVAERLAAVPDATAEKSDPLALARTAIIEAGLGSADAGRLLEKLDRTGQGALSEAKPDLLSAAHLPKATATDHERWLVNGLSQCADAGLVAVHDMGMDPAAIAVLKKLDDAHAAARRGRRLLPTVATCTNRQ
jgi:hypothetical protein